MKYSNYDDDDNDNDRGLSLPVIYTMIAMAGIVLIVILVVVSQNTRSSNRKTAAGLTPTPVVEAVDLRDGESGEAGENTGLRSEDLDFWNMYGDRNAGEVVEESPTPSPSPSPSEEPSPSPTPTEDPAYEDVQKNAIDFTKIKIVNDQMGYYPESEKTSKLGVELSKSNGKVDFDWLKRNGIDFVMLKIGGRGYESGVISLDEQFTDYIEAAKKADLDIGVSFYSQAVSVTEAVEEANFVVNQLQSYTIRYPVALVMEEITNDTARTDTLSVDQRSQIAEAFLQTIQYDGYHAILYGNEQWLMEKIRPDGLLTDYDVLLNDTNPLPEYPYEFKMWRYATDISLAGIENGGAYIISFVDYSMK
jgi:GH25 family lysozyme M1 (1,4-beta-N-acetylmuramidase)